jgi:alkyldihydroxyacetonephosphate synthase
MTRRRKFWGWGWEDEVISEAQRKTLGAMFKAQFPAFEAHELPEPTIDDIELPAPRIQPPSSLGATVSAGKYERAAHTYGKSTRDIIRGANRRFDAPPDLVAFPKTEQEVVDVLDWCARESVAAVPFGGGTSVCGGVEAGLIRGDYRGALSLDLGGLDRIEEIDRTSRAARIQGGIFGPALEDGLRPHGLTLRHFPQSFEFSTLGGWIATRSGGHYATLYTHIDEFVESLRVVTPSGISESRRLPGSGAGPSPDRLFIGSEGTLGIITEAWMRLQDRPKFRATASVKFPGAGGFLKGAEAVRLLSQSGLYPTNCRLIDPMEAQTGGAGDGSAALLVLGFESADHELEAWGSRALEICREAGGAFEAGALKTRIDAEGARGGEAGAWRQSFLRAPYMRDVIILMGGIAETFETAVTWDRFEGFYHAVREAGERGIARVCGSGRITCRFTHAYPDGPAPYFTVMAPGRAGSQLEQWDEIKAAVSEAIIKHGGTITHHHAVGRDHRPWYDRQRPEVFARALGAAKRELDPAGILNPGVLIDPARR